VIVIKLDHYGSGIRWVKAMTRVLPYWHLIPNLYVVDRGEVVDFRHSRGIHEGVPRLQIVDGITSFFVTASRSVITIDIG